MVQFTRALTRKPGPDPIERIHPPGTVDGGDVLVLSRHAFIGLSERTNEAGARQLGAILEKCGYSWTPVPVEAGLHLTY